ncbi:Pex12 amino terminal region-domain-containing protein [Lasiosphaeria miniovina]|uniref:RING-type E3 ubiquitin transferase n=1 Tax=Lasiosphaeria miniovina TaxID=1954250 RepID=A0AA40BIS9_9PEZI|nr:Pex12 amino terminal region-domain-containing protein [Lasiosphaeria miniovina]KAK0734999.1 Pex12 amino terminal region-domain-containing protein [Lasiosphaeria miniovina]
MRRRLQARLAVLAARQRDRDLHGRKLSAKPKASPSLEYRVERYLLTHLTSLTSGAHLRAATLAVFYFTGAYYSISKRLFGLRYVFTRRLDDGHSNPSGAGGRAGYEVLGVLLAVQMVVRGYLHVREQLLAAAPAPLSSHPHQQQEAEDYDDQQDFRERAALPFDANVSLDEHAYSANNELLVDPGGGGGRGNQRSLAAIGTTTHTPVPRGERARYDLSRADAVMGWIKGRQQRKCTLCLDEMKDPAATGCGHVFCWACIGDWVREKPECPLCRREAMVQHILPLRAA